MSGWVFILISLAWVVGFGWGLSIGMDMVRQNIDAEYKRHHRE